MRDENENKGRREDDFAFSKEDVPVVSEEEEEEEEHEGVIKEERNENHLVPNIHKAQTNTKKYKSEKSVKFLFREATKARNEHMVVNSTKKCNSKGKGVVNLEYEKEREDNEEDFSTPGDSKDSAQTMMKEEDSLANTNNAKGHRKRRKEQYVLPATQRPDSSNTFPMMGIPVAFPKGLTP